MKPDIFIAVVSFMLLLLYLYSYRERFMVLNEADFPFQYPTRFTNVISKARSGYNTSLLYPKDMIPKDLRCDPILDCPQKVKDKDGCIVTLPPMRTKCLGDRKEICKPIENVKSYLLNPSKKDLCKQPKGVKHHTKKCEALNNITPQTRLCKLDSCAK